jgi:DNA-directed RNA polymerase specialized sigma24 family protein
MTTALAVLDPVAHFNEVYRLHSPGIRAFLAQRLRDDYLAEDITAETFIEYWRSRVLRERYADTSVFGLLATIAVRQTWRYFNRTRSVADTPVDFEDTSRRRYDALAAVGLDSGADPERVARELDDALDAMNAAGLAWRKARQVSTAIKAGQASTLARLGEEHAAKFADSIAERLATAKKNEQTALDSFQAARTEVARLRDQLDAR